MTRSGPSVDASIRSKLRFHHHLTSVPLYMYTYPPGICHRCCSVSLLVLSDALFCRMVSLSLDRFFLLIFLDTRGGKGQPRQAEGNERLGEVYQSSNLPHLFKQSLPVNAPLPSPFYHLRLSPPHPSKPLQHFIHVMPASRNSFIVERTAARVRVYKREQTMYEV